MVGLQNIHIYVSGQNLLNINKFYKGWDPENEIGTGVWKFIQFMVNYKDSRDAIIYWAEQIPNNEADATDLDIIIRTIEIIISAIRIWNEYVMKLVNLPTVNVPA